MTMSKLDTLSIDHLPAVSGGAAGGPLRPFLPDLLLRRPPSLAELLRRFPRLLHKGGAIVG
jgi:hypothetical protein